MRRTHAHAQVGAIAMNALLSIWPSLFSPSEWNRRSRLRVQSRKKHTTTMSLEPLGPMVLLSAGVHVISRGVVPHAHSSEQHPLPQLARPHILGHVTSPHVLGHVTSPQVIGEVARPRIVSGASSSSDESTVVQTVSLGNTTTNFTNVALSPALNLFNPALGTLESVTVNHSQTVQSSITSQNLSTTSSTTITAAASVSSEIDGLSEPFSQPTTMLTSTPMFAGPFGSGTDTVVFPPLVATDSATTTFTTPSDLAFYTSSTGRTAVTLTMSATAAASASAPNGNLLTTVASSGSGEVTVTYTYAAPCPTIVSIGRTGLHHQQTRLVVTFDGAVDPTKAATASNYSVITPSGRTIRIISAEFNPATNSVTLIPETKLNVHYMFRLKAVLPCPDMQMEQTVVVPFGKKQSLIGFQNHHGDIVEVRNSRIVGIETRNGVFIPVHDGKIEKVRVARRSDGGGARVGISTPRGPRAFFRI